MTVIIRFIKWSVFGKVASKMIGKIGQRFSCAVERNSVFRLKGLSENVVNIDLDYIFMVDQVETGSYMFQGVTGLTKIQYRMNNESWFLQSYTGELGNKSEIFAIYSGPKFFPLGTHNWTFMGITTKLKLTKV